MRGDAGAGEIRIRSRVLQRMIRHARQEAPLECCGLLSGLGDEIDRAHPLTNQSRSRTQFSVPPAELFCFFKELRESGRIHLGIYHSHPASSCLPSAKDVKEFHYPEASYWIISLEGATPKVCCYLWQGGGFRETAFRVEPPR